MSGQHRQPKLGLLAQLSARKGGRRIKWQVCTGVPGHEIIDAAKKEDTDLVIIGAHGLTDSKHFCIGSTAERVARAAPCPVLVVREKEHEF